MSSTPVNCTKNGTASVIVTGTNGSYTYLWNDYQTQTSATATGLSNGSYMVIVNDSAGCISYSTVTVSGGCNILLLVKYSTMPTATAFKTRWKQV